jgi:Lrp/AsnC family leucine-responsive transcriptional regulator
MQEVIVKDIVALPEIIESYNIAGDYDFMLKILVKDMDSYQDFVMNCLRLKILVTPKLFS